MAANICLIAVLGTGLLCSGDGAKTVTDTGCAVYGEDIRALTPVTDAELNVMPRARKEAIVRLTRKYKRLCPGK